MCTCPRDPRVLRRCYSAAAAIFDRHLKARQRRWASVQEEYGAAGALRDEVGARLLDSVKVPRCAAPRAVLTRKDLAHPPRDVLVLGPHCSRLVDGLATLPAATTTADGADEEQWAFPKGAFDMIIANLNLHWVNDLEGVCGSVAGSLRENSSFLGALLGGDTLFELRSALLLAQQEIEGGVSPRISPMISLRDLAALLTKTGLCDVTVSSDDIRIAFPTLMHLLRDLQLMGESSALLARKPYIRRDVLARTAEIYRRMYATADGHLPATFQVLSFIAWTGRPARNIQ